MGLPSLERTPTRPPAEVVETARPSSDPRRGTNVAIGLPAVAVIGTILAAATTSDVFGPLGVSGALVLGVLGAVFGRYPLVLGQRTMYSLETPMVLLAAMVGGPVAGAIVGVGSGLGDVDGVWRRRAAYCGITALQGLAAGFAADAWRGGNADVVGAAAVASAAALVVGLVGRTLVQADRRSFSLARLATTTATDGGGIALAVPFVALLARTYPSERPLVLATAASLACVAFLVSRFSQTRDAAAERRQAALLHDWLTGAASRALFELELERVRGNVLRGARPAGLLVIDVDRFKEINDTAGHTIGDGVLRELVTRIGSTARTVDMLARWGGDEFCLLAPDVDSVAALEDLSARIRTAVTSSRFTFGDGSFAVTLSIGGTIVDGAVPAIEAFEQADRALYRAKQLRDAVCILDPPGSPDAVEARRASRAQSSTANAA